MKNNSWPQWKWLTFLALISLLAVGIFIGFSAYSGYLGFPLDDAWIHQVYARNLIQRGEWSFNPGQPSGGSTSPLWSLLLGGAYLISVNPVIWAAILGWLALLGTAILAESLVRRWIPDYSNGLPWIGIFFILEWHLVWAAVSGMETALFILIVFTVFYVLRKNERNYWLAGLLIGVCTWIRPDGITLLGPAGLILLFEPGSVKWKLQKLFAMLGAFLALFIPYLLFNLKLAGSIWPSTFSAKQAEYSASTGLPFFERLWSMFLPFLAGGGVVLLPGLLAAVLYAWRERKTEVIAIILWFTGYIFLFAIRLPVNYQHGRYMMPAMACFFLTGLWGMTKWMVNHKTGYPFRLIKRFWTISLVSVTLLFLAMGCAAYQTDVAIIETEMVRTARWIQSNTSPGSRIAAHDIGALGYFSDHEIIDLAGLVNPEVIPIIRNESGLRNYLILKGADYLVTFPGWYPDLTRSLQPVFQTSGKVSPQAGGENMAVFSLK